MDTIDERFVLYTTALFFCSVCMMLGAGSIAAWIAVAVLVGVELAYWIAGLYADTSPRASR
jgi:hypothetical protein